MTKYAAQRCRGMVENCYKGSYLWIGNERVFCAVLVEGYRDHWVYKEFTAHRRCGIEKSIIFSSSSNLCNCTGTIQNFCILRELSYWRYFKMCLVEDADQWYHPVSTASSNLTAQPPRGINITHSLSLANYTRLQLYMTSERFSY